MSNKLSHSSVNMLSECGKKYELHYIQRLRSNTASAALLFGSAIDKAVEKLVLSKSLDEAKELFYELWTEQEINGVKTRLENNPNIVYANNDLDVELLPNDFLKPLYLEELEKVRERKDSNGFDNLSVSDKIYYNQANWAVARKRGELMLEAVNEEILPKIKRVLSTQERIDLANDASDSVVGYVDMVADWDTVYGTETVVFDFKTSTRAYEPDAVKTSAQLALYVHAISEKYNTRKAGFIVLSKAIQKNRKKICSVCGNDGSGGRHKTCAAEVNGKRCGGEWVETIDPKCKVDVIIDEIPEQLENIVLENMDNVNKMIDSGIYIRNLSACVKPYGKCQFYDKCHNNSEKGLVKV